MSDYADDIAIYSSSAVDEDAVTGIVKHLGIALRTGDGKLVSCTDPVELGRVRDSWLKKKLAIGEDDAALDAAIAGVCTTMKGDKTKSRVTFYYLLAEQYGKLADLH